MIGGYCFINSYTLFEVKEPIYLYYTNKRDGNVPNVSAMDDNLLQDGVYIDAIFLYPKFIKMRMLFPRGYCNIYNVNIRFTTNFVKVNLWFTCNCTMFSYFWIDII